MSEIAANPFRGELALDLGEHKGYVLRPTFAAICAIEQDLNEGILPVAMRFLARQVGMRDAAVIVHRCGQAATENPKLTYAQVGELVRAQGLAKLLPQLAMMLDRALTDPDADPQTAATAETAAATAASPGAA